MPEEQPARKPSRAAHRPARRIGHLGLPLELGPLLPHHRAGKPRPIPGKAFRIEPAEREPPSERLALVAQPVVGHAKPVVERRRRTALRERQGRGRVHQTRPDRAQRGPGPRPEQPVRRRGEGALELFDQGHQGCRMGRGGRRLGALRPAHEPERAEVRVPGIPLPELAQGPLRVCPASRHQRRRDLVDEHRIRAVEEQVELPAGLAGV